MAQKDIAMMSRKTTTAEISRGGQCLVGAPIFNNLRDPCNLWS